MRRPARHTPTAPRLPAGRRFMRCVSVLRPVCAFSYAPHAALREKTSPLTRRIVPSKFHMSPASRSDARNCLNSLTPESPPPLRRLPIRPVAQTDGSFGQTSLQGPETSGNVLNRSLRCFLPCAAIEPGEGAYRPRDKHAGAGDSAPAGGEEPFGLFWAFRLHDDFIERVLVSLFLILTLLN